MLVISSYVFIHQFIYIITIYLLQLLILLLDYKTITTEISSLTNTGGHRNRPWLPLHQLPVPSKELPRPELYIAWRAE